MLYEWSCDWKKIWKRRKETEEEVEHIHSHQIYWSWKKKRNICVDQFSSGEKWTVLRECVVFIHIYKCVHSRPLFQFRQVFIHKNPAQQFSYLMRKNIYFLCFCFYHTHFFYTLLGAKARAPTWSILLLKIMEWVYEILEIWRTVFIHQILLNGIFVCFCGRCVSECGYLV